MTGALLFIVAIAWVAAAIFAGVFIGRRLPNGIWRPVVAVAVALVLLAAPLADEIVGMQQFRKLCEIHAVQHIDSNAKGRRVALAPRAGDTYAEGTAIKIRIDPWIYRDVGDGRVLISYSTLRAEGGWLVRLLGISETNSPLLFNPSCRPTDERGFISKYDITVVN
jgi:hypothetical protein